MFQNERYGSGNIQIQMSTQNGSGFIGLIIEVRFHRVQIKNSDPGCIQISRLDPDPHLAGGRELFVLLYKC